jgi:peptidase M28-like protein
MRSRSLACAALLAAVVAAAACGGGDDHHGRAKPAAATAAAASPDKFDGAAAYKWVERQVAYGPRPAGSKPSRRLAKVLRNALPKGHYQAVPHGLRNVLGTIPGRDPKRKVVVGAHYDTKDIPGFVGAIDSGSGTGVLMQLAATIKPRKLRPTIVFALFDGEESPRGVPDSKFEKYGLRGSKVAAPTLKDAEAMILLDFVGNLNLKLHHEENSDVKLWAKLRAAAKTVGAADRFPAGRWPPVSDDHLPFIKLGIPSIDLIDFDFACFHETCDDLSQVSEDSLDDTGESILQLLATL